MAVVFEVQSKDISELNELNLTKLLKLLLHLEAKSAGLCERAVDVALNIKVADGGEDGRIDWKDGPPNTNFLPARLVQFQNKATQMGPADCARELIDSRGNLKAMVADCFSNDGVYILFTTQELNQQQKQERITAIREKLRAIKFAKAETALIEIYDASKIQGWVNRFAPAITATLNWIGKPLIHGLQIWEEWQRYEDLSDSDFVIDPERRDGSNRIRDKLKAPRNSARIIGPSGLGKTRLALELCRDSDENDFFSKQVVYFDAAFLNENLSGHVKSWVRAKLGGLLVVDNCPLDLHKALRREIEHRDSKLALLTLDYNPEKDSNTDTLELKPLHSALIKSMLEPIYGKAIPDLDRVVSFAHGFPQMAVLLARARLDKAENLGRLNDDEILKKMLWGGGQENAEMFRILCCCSLFEKFGMDGEARSEYEFIADNIAHISYDSLVACIYKFATRGIIDGRGRYRRIIPKPLAIRLASEWWSTTSSQTQTTLISTEMPGELTDSFCSQISMLDFLPGVKKLSEGLCGEQGPFGQAEVILSVRGSNLFRAFVELNPEVTSASLFRILSSLSLDERLAIRDEVRRNLVRALEKLCFHASAFERSAKCMLYLAEAENEHWSNNATGNFKQLFQTFLSGTEAPPELRFRVIDFALASTSSAIRILGVEALGSAIDTHGGHRQVGAEYQGSGKVLEDWMPKIWQEAFDYWIGAIERLATIAAQDDEYSEKALQLLGGHIRGMVQRSRDTTLALDKAIRKIVEAKKPLWSSAIESIKHTLTYDKEKMPDEVHSKLVDWLELLRPSDLGDKIKLIVSIPPWEHERNEKGEYIDVAQNNAAAFAHECSTDITVLEPYVEKLLTGEQRHAAIFAKVLVESSKSWEPLLNNAIAFIKKNESFNFGFLLGLLQGIFSVSPKEWEQVVDSFESDPALQKLYTHAVNSGGFTQNHLDKILMLIKSGSISPQDALVFSYGKALSHFNPAIVRNFIDSLLKISDTSAWVALDILTMYCHGSKDLWDACRDSFRSLMLHLKIDEHVDKRHMQAYEWNDVCGKLLQQNDPELARYLAAEILSSTKRGIEFSDLHHYVKPIMRMLVKDYWDLILPQVTEAIKTARPIEEHHLSSLFRKEDSSARKEASLFAELSNEQILEWCKSEPELAPSFIAHSTDVYTQQGEALQLSSRAKLLIDHYGDNLNILTELGANMGTFGWSGSVVPIYENEVKALSPLVNHAKESVREWANRRISYLKKAIETERIRDEEHDWGIY